VQHRLLAEEKARKHEQERSVGLAEKLADKDREVAELQAQLAAARAEPARTRKSQRTVALESRLHQLSTRLREAEMDKDQLGIKLSEKDEENRLKGRKISELLFRVQVGPPAESRSRENRRAEWGVTGALMHLILSYL
jgi:chromosome segregation ATPase